MLENTFKAITDYAEAYKQANEVYYQTTTYIKGNYKPNTELYNQSMETAETVLNNYVNPFKSTCVETVKNDIEHARKSIKEIVNKPLDADSLFKLSMIKEGRLNDTEKEIILENASDNYMFSKLLCAELNKPFDTAENVLENLNDLESRLDGYFATYKGEKNANISYDNALMLNGSLVENVGKMTDDFLNKYCDQNLNIQENEVIK